MSDSFMSCFGIIDYKGYKYYIYDNVAAEICKRAVKNIPLITNIAFNNNGIYAKCTVKDSLLFLKELSLYISEKDVSNLEIGYPCTPEISYTNCLIVVDGIPKTIRAAVLKYRHLDIPISYHGEVAAKQIYVDEVELECPKVHNKMNTFVFSKGNLIESKSCILTSDVSYISKVTWNNQNLTNYIKEINNGQIDKTSRKLFFVNPTGTVLQNEKTISLVVNYALNNISSSDLLKQLFDFEIPKIKVKCMAETEPASGKFSEVVYDLIPYIVKNNDSKLMKKLYKYIDIKDYTEYCTSILSMIEK